MNIESSPDVVRKGEAGEPLHPLKRNADPESLSEPRTGATQAAEAGVERGAAPPEASGRTEPSDFTRLLQAHAAGDPAALHQLMPRVYDELRGLARGRMRRERADHTLGATDLVHEAFMRLVRLDRIAWRNRAHFLAIASQAMRHVLLDHADQRRAGKRGGGIRAVTLDRLSVAAAERDDAVIGLCEALEELERIAPRQARVVECRFFAGLSIDETAAALGISQATVSREWTVARAWLHAQLNAAAPRGAN